MREKLLIVCHGNINRSVLLAALLEKRGRYEIRQAALKSWGNPGWRSERATKRMRYHAAMIGLDLEMHRSTKLELNNIYWADTVLYFDGGNYRRLCNVAQEMKNKFVCVGSYIGQDRIADPNFYRAESLEFEEIVKQIVAASVKITASGL